MNNISDDIFVPDKNQGNIPMGKSKHYLEKIDSELLDKQPDMLPFCNIRTDYDDITILGRKAAKEKQKKDKRAAGRKKHRPLKKILTILFLAAFLAVAAVSSACIYLLYDYAPAGNAFDGSNIKNTSIGESDGIMMLFDLKSTDGENDISTVILISDTVFSSAPTLTVFPQNTKVQNENNEETTIGELTKSTDSAGAMDALCRTYDLHPGGYIRMAQPVFTDFVNSLGPVSLPPLDTTSAKAMSEEGYTVSADNIIDADGNILSAYCRIIKGQNETFRAERQLNATKAIFQKIRYTNPLNVLKSMKNILSSSESDLSKLQFCGLAFGIAFRAGNIDGIIYNSN